MIEMPKLGIRQCGFKLQLPNSTRAHCQTILRTRQNQQPGLLVHNSERRATCPRTRAAVSAHTGNFDLCLSVSEVWCGMHANSLDINLRRYQKFRRAIDSTVMRPIARTTSGQHVFVECVVNPYSDNVGRAPVHKRSDVKVKPVYPFRACSPAGCPFTHTVAVWNAASK